MKREDLLGLEGEDRRSRETDEYALICEGEEAIRPSSVISSDSFSEVLD